MATIAEIVNLIQAGANSVLGTGQKGYKPSLKKVSALWLLPAGFKLDKTRVLNVAYVQELQATGKLIILKGIRGFSDNTPDDVTEELEDGTKQLQRQGLYELSANFINGQHFNAALNSLSGFSSYDVAFVDRDGSIMGTLTTDGSIKGLTTGMLQAQKYTWATDSSVAREGLMLQLLERSEFDVDYALIEAKQLDFNPNRIDGVNEAVVSIPTVPVSGATSVVVKVLRKQDKEPVEGLVLANFSVSGATAVTETSAGVYSFTVPATSTNDVITAQLYDTGENRNVIFVDTDLYKSNIASVTVL